METNVIHFKKGFFLKFFLIARKKFLGPERKFWRSEKKSFITISRELFFVSKNISVRVVISQHTYCHEEDKLIFGLYS